MSYTKTNWQNLPNQTTPINATNLNHIEQGIYDATYENGVNVSNEVDDTYRVNLLHSKNLFDINSMVELIGAYRAFGQGQIVQSASYNGLKIPVKSNATYTITINANYSNLTYWDNTFTRIGGEAFSHSGGSGTFTTPSGCFYITLAAQNNYTQIMLNEGSTALPYEPFIQNQIVVDNEKYSDTLNVGTSLDSKSRVNVLHSKNLLPNNGSTITTNGITFTKNSDGSITINGTSTARADLYIFGGTTDNGNYLKIKKGTYSFDRTNLTDGKIFFAFREKTAGTKYETLTNNGAIETMATQDCYFYGVMIGVESGNTINNLTIYPMLNEGSTALPYEPFIQNQIVVNNEKYTDTLNVGTSLDSKSRVNLLHSNNLTDGIIENGSIDTNTGKNTSSPSFSRFANYSSVEPNTTYTLKISQSNPQIVVYYYTGTSYISFEFIQNTDTYTFTTPSNCYRVKFRLSGQGLSLTNTMLNKGSTVLPYEPYVTPSIYVDNEEIYSKEYVLYDNPAGTNANLTLNDNPYNFDYVEIFYKNSWLSSSIRINMNDDIGTKSVAMTIPYGTSTNLISIHSSVASITTSAINFDANRDRDVAVGASGTTVQTTRQIKITKVVGYK